MTKKEIKAERIKVQKLIKKVNKKLISKIKKNHPELTRAMKQQWDISNHELINPDYYDDMEYLLD